MPVLNMFQPDSNCGEKDEESYARLPQDWIAVFHYPERGTLDDGCPSVIDRVSVPQSLHDPNLTSQLLF